MLSGQLCRSLRRPDAGAAGVAREHLTAQTRKYCAPRAAGALAKYVAPLIPRQRRQPRRPAVPFADSSSDGAGHVQRLRLIMMRHADSENLVGGVRDHDRQITLAGHAEAASVARQLAELGWVPDLVVCSDSVRTRQTLEAMQSAHAGIQAAEVHLRSDLYTVAALDGQTRSHLERIIVSQTAEGDAGCILCLGHNKGWEECASSLAGEYVKLRPCTAALLDQHAVSWKEAFEAGRTAWGLVCTVSPQPAPAGAEDEPAAGTGRLDSPAFG